MSDVRWTQFEHFTASGDSRHCGQLCSTVFKLTCSWAPPFLRPLDFIHMMNVPRPSRLRLLFCFCVLLSSQKLKSKNGVGLGMRLHSDIFALTVSMVVCMDVETTVNWKIFELKIFHNKKISYKKIRSYEWARKILNALAEGRCHLNSSGIRLRVRDIAWRSSEKIVAFKATMYTKRYRRQLLEK